MTPELSTHLSEEAMDDVLIGLASPESDAHLAACSLCRSQLQEFRSAMQVFNQTSLAWSEDRSKAFHHSSAKPKIRPAIFVPLSWAMVAAVLLAIGFPMWNHHYLSRNYAPKRKSLRTMNSFNRSTWPSMRVMCHKSICTICRMGRIRN